MATNSFEFIIYWLHQSRTKHSSSSSSGFSHSQRQIDQASFYTMTNYTILLLTVVFFHTFFWVPILIFCFPFWISAEKRLFLHQLQQVALDLLLDLGGTSSVLTSESIVPQQRSLLHQSLQPRRVSI